MDKLLIENLKFYKNLECFILILMQAKFWKISNLSFNCTPYTDIYSLKIEYHLIE